MPREAHPYIVNTYIPTNRWVYIQPFFGPDANRDILVTLQDGRSQEWWGRNGVGRTWPVWVRGSRARPNQAEIRVEIWIQLPDGRWQIDGPPYLAGNGYIDPQGRRWWRDYVYVKYPNSSEIRAGVRFEFLSTNF